MFEVLAGKGAARPTAGRRGTAAGREVGRGPAVSPIVSNRFPRCVIQGRAVDCVVATTL